MRLFHAQILDDYLTGAGSVTLAVLAWSHLLSRAEAIKFTFVTSEVTGTAPTLSASMYSGLAAVTDVELTKPLLTNNALSPGVNTTTATYSPTDGTYPLSRHVYLILSLNGTNPAAHVRLWACGRGPQLLGTEADAQSSFNAQYQAALSLEDEDRLPLKKRTLRQGASQAFSPATFYPSLKWER